MAFYCDCFHVVDISHKNSDLIVSVNGLFHKKCIGVLVVIKIFSNFATIISWSFIDNYI